MLARIKRLCDGRQAERVVVPDQDLEAIGHGAEPIAGAGIVELLHVVPADLLGRHRLDLGAQRLGDELRSQTMTQHRQVPRGSAPDQSHFVAKPWMTVIDAHRAAEEHEPRDIVDALGNGVALVDANQVPRDVSGIEVLGEPARIDPVLVTEDADGFPP
jgi:hypothetical protein